MHDAYPQTLFGKMEEVVSKAIDYLKKAWSLTHKGSILDVTGRAGFLSCVHTCRWETENLSAITVLRSFFWVSEENELFILIY